MIKKSINPFTIIYGIAVIIGIALANVFLRKKSVNLLQAQQKYIEALKIELKDITDFNRECDYGYVLEEMEVEEIMKIVSKKRGFRCSCIDTEILKKLLNGEPLNDGDEDDLQS